MICTLCGHRAGSARCDASHGLYKLPVQTTHRVRCWVLRGYPFPRGRKPGVPRLVRYRALNVPSGKPAGFTATWRTREQALKAKHQGLRRIYRRVVPAQAWVVVEALL